MDIVNLRLRAKKHKRAYEIIMAVCRTVTTHVCNTCANNSQQLCPMQDSSFPSDHFREEVSKSGLLVVLVNKFY